MSPEQNKAVLRRVVDEAFNQRKLDVFDELVADDFVGHHLPPGLPPGREGLKAFMRAFWTAFPDIHFTFEDEVAEDAKVAGRGHFAGTHQDEFMGVPPTGKRVDVKFHDIWRFENGRWAEYWGQADTLTMLQQLGALPTPESHTP